MTGTTPESRTREFRGIQALRGAAAMLVVAYHCLEVWSERISTTGPVTWPTGAAGVDLFFVISGFVMVCAASRLPRGAWQPFLRRRLLRIVPLYWLMTGLKVVATLAAPGLALRTTLTAGTIVASLLFLPVTDAGGRFRPVLPVGWTLSFEMLFYALFAMALACRALPLLFVTPPLLLLAVLPPPAGPGGLLFNPMVLEFAFGAAIGTAWLKGFRLSRHMAALLGSAGVVLLFGLPRDWVPSRELAWGLPATAIVVAAIILEDRLRPLLPRLVIALGDASYAIYLSHGFVLAALPALLPHAGTGTTNPAPAVMLGICLSASCGWLLHRTVEAPLLSRLSRRSRSGATAQTHDPSIVLVADGAAPHSSRVCRRRPPSAVKP